MYIDLRLQPAELDLTYKCNLSCKGCNKGCFLSRGHPTSMTMEQVISTLDDIEREGFKKQLSILGGEPTLHPQFAEIVKIAHSRGFFIKVYSNCYTKKSRTLVDSVKHLAWIHGTRKLTGSVSDLDHPFVFCAPKDLGVKPTIRCEWEQKCGYSVNSLGYSVCTMGNMISYWQGLPFITRDIRQINDPSWQQKAKAKLCKYCGAFFDSGIMVAEGVRDFKGTKLTDSWLQVFSGANECTGS